MGLIIDTSALVSIERHHKDLASILGPYTSEAIVMPAIVWAELLVGVRLASSANTAAQRRARLEQIRIHVPIVDFSPEIAEHYADIYRECSKSGKMIPQNDMAVAATARRLQFGVLIAESDESHFRCVQGLKLVMI